MEFERGYSGCEERMKKNKHLRTCFNCKYYADKKDECENNQVVSYDVSVVDGKPVCHK